MFDVMNYAERNDVEVSVRKGHDGRTVWEIFLRDHRLNMTEFTRIIDIEIRGRLDQDAYIELRCEALMDKIRSARMKNEYAEIENKDKESAQQPQAAGRISYYVSEFAMISGMFLKIFVDLFPVQVLTDHDQGLLPSLPL